MLQKRDLYTYLRPYLDFKFRLTSLQAVGEIRRSQLLYKMYHQNAGQKAVL